MKSSVLLLFILTLVLCMAGEAQAQSAAPEQPRVFLDTTYAPPSGTTRTVSSGGNLQAALDAAVPGDTIVLQAGATFTGNFVLPVKSGSAYIYIRTSAPDSSLPTPGTRVSPSYAGVMPKIVSANSDAALRTAIGAHNYRLVGIELTVSSSVDLNYGVVTFGDAGTNQDNLSEVPHDLVVDRCYIHGNATGAISRGVAMNAASAAVVDSYISDMHSEGTDTQAIMGWNGPGPFKIVNNYLEAAGENVMFGGGDPSISGLVPSDIEVRRNLVVKLLSWRVGDPGYAGKHWSVKNLFELKNARRVLVDGNTFENSWGDAQTGFAIVFTPRNQDGAAVWCTVEDVTFTDNTVRHAASGVNVLGRDDIYTSQPLARVLVRNNLFDDISGDTWNGYGRFAQILNGTTAVTIDHNTIIHTGPVIFAEGPTNPGFVYTNNISRHNDYGVIGTGTACGMGTLTTYFIGCDFRCNVLAGGSAASYPPTNYFPAGLDNVGFVNAAAGNYRLSPTSPYVGYATDGSAVGADFDAIDAAQAGTTTPPPPPAPLAISSVTATSITTTGATITWTTSRTADTQVEYGTTTSYGSSTTRVSSLVTAHSQGLAGLLPGTAYNFRVKSTDANGVAAVSGNYTFKTIAAAQPTTGTGLAAQYFNDPGTGVHFGSLALSRTDATVNFDWATAAPGTGVQADNFSVRWTGKVLAPVSGAYTFATTSDDGVRLWVNGQLLVDNWTDHGSITNTAIAVTLTAGQSYDVKMEFYDRAGGAVAKLLWAYPGRTRVAIPQAQLFPVAQPTTGTGLTAQYFNDPGTGTHFATLALSRTDATVNFDWGSAAPGTGVQADNFSVRWTGRVQAPVSGAFTFATSSDDGVRLWINGQLVIDNWTDHGPTTNTASAVTLTAGQSYDVKMEFYERSGGAVAKLLWAYPGQAQQAVPQVRLFTAK